MQEALTFKSIYTFSAGNAFRAAALLVISEEAEGRKKSEFTASDVDVLRNLLATEGIHDILQSDPAIGRRVNLVAKMAGVQALCSTIFCDSILGAYHADSGANLVIVDARDSVGIMRRNRIVGSSVAKIDPASILSVYVETPVEVAAARMGGNLGHKIDEISSRRHMDATRKELPVTRPSVLIDDFNIWVHQFEEPMPGSEVARPYRLNNGEGVTLSNVRYFAGCVAVIAQDVACCINSNNRLS